jgi:cell division transport system ATP-binding protein
MDANTALCFEQVGLQFPDGTRALRQVDFTALTGSATVLMGPSGAGKTSFLSLAGLVLPPSEGSVSMFGVRPWKWGQRPTKLRRRVGAVFQDFRLAGHLDVFANVAMPLRIRGIPERDYQDNVRELLHWVGLEHRVHARTAQLSGGEKQRLAIARAVVSKPDILLADEPTGSVDPDMGLRILHLLMELNRMGATLIVATHDERVARTINAPIVRLHEGRRLTLEGVSGLAGTAA